MPVCRCAPVCPMCRLCAGVPAVPVCRLCRCAGCAGVPAVPVCRLCRWRCAGVPVMRAGEVCRLCRCAGLCRLCRLCRQPVCRLCRCRCAGLPQPAVPVLRLHGRTGQGRWAPRRSATQGGAGQRKTDGTSGTSGTSGTGRRLGRGLGAGAMRGGRGGPDRGAVRGGRRRSSRSMAVRITSGTGLWPAEQVPYRRPWRRCGAAVRRVIKARPPHLRTGRDLRAHRRRPTCASSRIAAAETLWEICVPLVSFRRRQTFLEAGFPTASRSRALSTRPFVFSFA